MVGFIRLLAIDEAGFFPPGATLCCKVTYMHTRKMEEKEDEKKKELEKVKERFKDIIKETMRTDVERVWWGRKSIFYLQG